MSDKYCGEFKGFNPDELIGDTYEPIITRNIEVGSNAEVKRGELLAASTPTGVYQTATAADTAKFLVVARDNFTADSDCKITTAYTSGVFNRERLVTGSTGTTVVDALEFSLRQQNIFLTGLREV